MLHAHVNAPHRLHLQQRGAGLSRGSQHIMAVAMLLISDTTMAVGAFMLAYRLRFETDLLPIQHLTSWGEYMQMVVVTVMTLLATLATRGQYALRRGTSSVDLAWNISASVSVGVSVSIAITTILFKFDYPRAALVAAWGMSIVFILAERLCIRAVTRRLRVRGIACSQVLIVGAGTAGREVLLRMQARPELGYHPVGILDYSRSLVGTHIDGCPILGHPRELPDIVRTFRVDEVVIALPGVSSHELMGLVDQIPSDSVDVKLLPDVLQITTSAISIDDLAGVPLMTVKRGALRTWDRFIKRTVDIVVSVLALVLLSLPMLIVAAIVKVTSEGPVFYVQERVGHNGLRFKALKFRSMWYVPPAAEKPAWTKKDDDRRTRFGTFIRHHSIDEMPQFLNVLAGQMSIVGPRPEQPSFVEQFAQTIPRYMDRHQEKCGLTGWAQVNGLRGDTPIEDRTKYDLYYVDNWSLLFDFKIMLMTLKHLISDDQAT